MVVIEVMACNNMCVYINKYMCVSYRECSVSESKFISYNIVLNKSNT